MSGKKIVKTINWKIAADRVAIGEKIELESMPDYWVRPRRYTKQGEAEILAAQTRAIGKSKQIATSLMNQMPAPGSDAEEMAGLTAQAQSDIAMIVMQNASADMVGKVEENTLRILHGIEDHNFNGDPEKATQEWAAEVMGYADIANEILALVKEQNLPLGLRTSHKSGTSPNGSSTDQALKTDAETSTD
jgi:hypothetical protein